MQWYVDLMTLAAAAFLWKVAAELIGRPLTSVFRLRRESQARLLSCCKLSLPRPRELAISSQAIRDYDRAMRDVRNAERVFADLGARFLALSESEPAIRSLMALFGFDTVLAGHELINLSQVYASARSDSGEFRREIEQAIEAASLALVVSRCHSHDELTKIRLEPMYLRNAAYPRGRKLQVGKPHIAPVRPLHPQGRFRRSTAERLASIS